MDWSKLIKIGHFILVMILVVTVGLYLVSLMLNIAGAYQCINDPCFMCEDITGYKCEKGNLNISNNLNMDIGKYLGPEPTH